MTITIGMVHLVWAICALALMFICSCGLMLFLWHKLQEIIVAHNGNVEVVNGIAEALSAPPNKIVGFEAGRVNER